MPKQNEQISQAFKILASDAPEFAQVWGSAIRALGEASVLDKKTRGIAHLSVLAALNRTSGIPFHVSSLKQNGATREEVISAILLGLPVAGHIVTQSLPAAIEAFDAE